MKPLVQLTNTVFTHIIYQEIKIDTDLTGKLSVTYNRGNIYVFVLYDYEKKKLTEPMKSIENSDFIRVFTYLNEPLMNRGINPSYMRLENKASPAFQRELKAKNIDYN